MWSYIEMNETLQLTSEQGFPACFDFEKHKDQNFKIEDFKDIVFEFKNKPSIRIYQLPPVRNFLVHNIDWKWLYWWLIHMIEVTHDNINQTTSWKFKIFKIFTPEEMKEAPTYYHPSKAKPYLED